MTVFVSSATKMAKKTRLYDKFLFVYFKFWDWLIKFVAGDFVGWLSHRQRFGGLRFKLIRFIYGHLPYYSTARNEIWKFVLNYLPSLSMTYWRGLEVMDVGCTDSLLLYEIANRGYAVLGVDIRDYQSKLPNHIRFFKHDILDPKFPELVKVKFRYIVCISVIELVGVDMYGDLIDPQGDRKALENLHKMLYSNGYLILVVTTENFRCLKGKGYHMWNFLQLIQGLFTPVEVTQRCGHICSVLIKV
jgi:2-polyprenyl-3-methyl-5-hydroxy-6-metoxy-1,4-benzoquinol methylase